MNGTIVRYPRKRKSPVVTPAIAAEIKALLRSGTMNQHDIAARYRINQGRVSEIKTGLKFPGVEPTQLDLFLNSAAASLSAFSSSEAFGGCCVGMSNFPEALGGFCCLAPLDDVTEVSLYRAIINHCVFCTRPRLKPRRTRLMCEA